MSGIVIHNYKIKAKGVKNKVIYHFSDLHLTESDELSTDAERKLSIEKTEFWKSGREYFASTYHEPLGEAQAQSTHTLFFEILSEVNRGDAFIMTGDIMDYCGGANFRFVGNALQSATCPYIYVCGNHESPNDFPELPHFSALKNPVQTLELEDIIICGVDNSKGEITPEQVEKIKKLLLNGKPVIIAMHIPVMTEENKVILEKCEGYYILNRKGASKEVYEFIDLIKQNSDKIIAVLAGHLHFANNSEIAPKVTQYVASQGMLGNINRYEIGDF